MRKSAPVLGKERCPAAAALVLALLGGAPAPAQAGGARKAPPAAEIREEQDRFRREAEERRVETIEQKREAAERRRSEAEERRERRLRGDSAANRYDYKKSEFWTSLEFRVRGRVQFTDDDRDVRSVEPGGHVFLEARSGLLFRSLFIRAGEKGVERIYSAGGVERPFDDAARAWLAGLLPGLIREIGHLAPERVERLSSRGGGATAVLDEISRIHGSSTKRRYFEELVSRAETDASAIERALRQAAREIQSDGERARLLEFVADTRGLDARTRPAFFDALDRLSSDGERRRVLSALLHAPQASQELLDQVCRSAGRMSSDGEKSRLLTDLAENHELGAGVQDAYFRTLSGIGSNGERRRVLAAAVERNPREKDVLRLAMREVRRMSSDSEKARVLETVAAACPADEALISEYARTLETIRSGSEYRRAFHALASRSGFAAMLSRPRDSL